MADCVFCKIVAGELPSSKIYEDDLVLSFMDIAPLSRGHTLVIPKNHYEYFVDVPPDEAAAVSAAMLKVAPAVTASQNADGFNLLLANGACAGQVIFHVHFHIIPRKNKDGVGFAWRHGAYADGEMAEVHQSILSALGG
jgi:histidine triad (HIT) family protein